MSEIVRAIDINGDWLFGAGYSDYKSGNAAVAQSIQTRLYSFLGNCFFDAGAGINWPGFLGQTGSNNELALQLAVSSVILNTENVGSINQLSINLNRSTRQVSISYQVQTAYSTTLTNQLTINI